MTPKTRQTTKGLMVEDRVQQPERETPHCKQGNQPKPKELKINGVIGLWQFSRTRPRGGRFGVAGCLLVSA